MVIINKDSELLIKKLKIEVVVRIIISTLLFIGLFITLFTFQKREYQTLFVVLLTLMATLYFGYILFVITQYLTKFKSYSRFVNHLKHSSKVMNDIIVLKREKDTHVFGFGVKVYSVKEIDDNKEFYLYIDEFHKEELEVDKKYQITSYHSVLIEFEEKEDEA